MSRPGNTYSPLLPILQARSERRTARSDLLLASEQWPTRVSFPFTAAGPRGSRTLFPSPKADCDEVPTLGNRGNTCQVQFCPGNRSGVRFLCSDGASRSFRTGENRPCFFDFLLKVNVTGKTGARGQWHSLCSMLRAGPSSVVNAQNPRLNRHRVSATTDSRSYRNERATREGLCGIF